MREYLPEEKIAIALYETGHKLSFSTDIAGYLSYGYGRLDDNGFWQWPLPYECLRPLDKIAVDFIEQTTFTVVVPE